MTKRAVVFDLDGTLIDSRGDIALACNEMLKRVGREELREEVIAGFVGDGARLLVARALDLPLESSQVSAALDVFLDVYEANPVVSTRALPGVETSLAYLDAARVAICTNKPRRTTMAVLRALRWVDRFDAIVAGGDTEEKKPHPAPLLRVAELLEVSGSDLIMVGDGPQDVLAGKAAGAFTIGVRGGILPEEKLVAAEPDLLLDSLEDLPRELAALGVLV